MVFAYEFNIAAFFIGAGATFAYKFLSEYKRNLKKSKSEQHILTKWVWDDYIYIILGGVFTMSMSPTKIEQALLFGASWEAIFVQLFDKKMQEDKDDVK